MASPRSNTGAEVQAPYGNAGHESHCQISAGIRRIRSLQDTKYQYPNPRSHQIRDGAEELRSLSTQAQNREVCFAILFHGGPHGPSDRKAKSSGASQLRLKDCRSGEASYFGKDFAAKLGDPNISVVSAFSSVYCRRLPSVSFAQALDLLSRFSICEASRPGVFKSAGPEEDVEYRKHHLPKSRCGCAGQSGSGGRRREGHHPGLPRRPGRPCRRAAAAAGGHCMQDLAVFRTMRFRW